MNSSVVAMRESTGTATPPTEVAPTTHPARLDSLDAFRGFTMCWLMGGKALAVASAALAGLAFLRVQLPHSAWEGVRYYDISWPSFMLMVGVAVPVSYARRSQTQTRGGFLRGAWKRAAILFLLGSLRESLSDGTPR